MLYDESDNRWFYNYRNISFFKFLLFFLEIYFRNLSNVVF